MASKTMYELEILLGAKKASSFSRNINDARQSLDAINSVGKKVAVAATASLAVAGRAAMDSMDTFRDFEQEMANTASIAGASEFEYQKMEKAAREAGKSTTKTAQESAAALGYMSLAGWDVNTSTSNLIPILKLSESTQMDLATASDLVTDSTSALGIKTSELNEYLDIVAQENNKANTSSEQLMQAYIRTGGAARTLGADLLDTSTAIGILSNNGTKGEKAGTAMNAMLTRLASNSAAQKRLKELNVSIFDSQGKFIGLEESLEKINDAMDGMSTKKQSQALKDIAGTQYYSKMAYLLDAVEKGADGAESAWDSLERELESSDGALDKMNDRVTDTAEGALARMNSALDDMKISFADSFDGEYVDILNSLSTCFNNASESIADFSQENEVEIHQFVTGVKEDLSVIMDMGGNAVSWLIENSDVVISVIAGLGSTMAAANITGKVLKIAATIATLSPAILVAGGMIALTSAVAGYVVHEKRAEKELGKANLEKHFGNLSLSLETLDETAQKIVGKRQLTQISDMLESIGNTDAAVEAMADSMRNVNEIRWKMSAGIKLDQDDKETYQKSIEEYVNQAQEAVESQGYTVSIATNLLLGKNNAIGAENDEFFRGLDTELNRLEKKLQKKMEKAVENGVDINTDASIQKLLGKVSEITNAVTEAENEASLQAIQLDYSGKDLASADIEQLISDISKYEQDVIDGAKEAYESSMTALNARRNMGDITQAEYDVEKAEIDEGFYSTQAKAIGKGADYILRTIEDTYPEISGKMEGLQQAISSGLNDAFANGVKGDDINSVIDSVIDEALLENGVTGNDGTVEAIERLFKSGLGDIWNNMDTLKGQMQENGAEIPEAFAESFNNIESLSAITGVTEDALILAGETIANSDAHAALVSAANETGQQIDEAVIQGIGDLKPEVQSAVQSLMGTIQSAANGQIHLNGQITLNSSMASNAVSEAAKASNSSSEAAGGNRVTGAVRKSGPAQKLHKNASGGIYNNPILTTFAEAGPEAAIPLDGSNRAKSLWSATGEILGMRPQADTHVYRTVKAATRDSDLYTRTVEATSGAGGTDPVMNAGTSAPAGFTGSISYSPKIVIQGNADANVVNSALEMSRSKFEEMMNDYMANKKRVSFG